LKSIAGIQTKVHFIGQDLTVMVSGYNRCTQFLKVMLSVCDISHEYYHYYTFSVHF